MSHTILITGATGNIGAPLLQSLLAEPTVGKVIALVRAESIAAGYQRLAKALELATGSVSSDIERNKLEVLPGDITLEHLGLAPHRYDAVAAQITHIVHSAAQTQFTLPLECARSVNCTGTQNVVALARLAAQSGNLQRMIHVSTGYVCGNASGLIAEDFTPATEFANTYEQTKAETESWLLQNAPDLPITIVRPTIVVGDSHTGRINTFNVLYTPLHFILRGAMSVPEAALDTSLDVVSLDYVVRAISYLLLHGTDSPSPIHLAAGRDRSVTVGQIVEIAARCAESHGFSRRATKHSKHTASMAIYDPHVTLRREFDTTTANRMLAPQGIVPQPLSEYLSILMDYALKANWGKRPVSEPTTAGERQLCAA